MKWSELSMTEKNEVIKMAVAQGIKDIPSIKNLYEESVNGSRRFEDGGTIDGGTPFKITVTGKDRRPAWKGMYQNPNLVGKKKYRSLSGKVFNTKEEAIKDNTDAKYGRGIYASKDIIHSVRRGDTLWGIAKANNIDVNTLRRLNPNIKGDLIHTGDKIKVGEIQSPTLHDIRKEWEKEKVLNTDNLKAIQGIKHKDNYVVIDKLNNVLTVYDKNNQPVYSTSNISTGKSGNDYNTITYVDKNGRIRSGAGNESTPAGITKITGTGVYHGFPSFTRGRHQGGGFEDIASSLHFGGTKSKKASNGCVRLDGQSLQDLSNFIGVGTDVYTMPEKKGSRFKVKDGKLSFVADNPYGEQSGDKRYWDDYNTYTDKSYSPLTIVDRKKQDNPTYSKNRKAYADAIANSKERLQQKFNIDSDTYNRIASLALGIAEQETKYGTSRRKAIKDLTPDFVLDTLRGNNNRSRGITQIKLHGDNQEMQDIYSQLGITDESLDSPENAAIATMARLSQMYNTEVLGRNFTGEGGVTIDPYDALLYKWMGRNSELSNHTATPELNNYINNVKRYQDDFGLYTMRADGGNLYPGGGFMGMMPINIPAVISGTKDTVRKKLYKNLNPTWDYSNPISRVFSAITDTGSDYMYKKDELTDDAFATYLQIPIEERRYNLRLQKSKYRPTKGNSVGEIYALPLKDTKEDKGTIVEGADKLGIGESAQAEFVPLTGSTILGNYTISKGHDAKGTYVSYYDEYDLNPYRGIFADQPSNKVPSFIQNIGDLSFGIGKPFTIYDRIYLDDYYGVKEPTHATYLPEVTVWGNKKADGGSIHIAPSKRGTFTAAASKHGMDVQEFASKVLAHPENYSLTMRKKANFARNASKWKH